MRLSGYLLLFFLTSSISGAFLCDGQILAPSAVYNEPTAYLPADRIFYFSSIQMQSLSCNGPDAGQTYTFDWTKYNSTNNTWSQPLQSQIGNSSQLLISESGGYQVRITGPGVDNIYRCWAFEPSLNETGATMVVETCSFLDLRAVNDSLPLVYYTPTTGNANYVQYERTYNWAASTGTVLPQHPFISIDAPVEDTQFEVNVRDKFGNQSVATLDYIAIAVKAQYKSEEVKREVPNEIHTSVEGSAPIEVRFNDDSKGNVSAWEWRFGNTGVAFNRNPFYVFTELGSHTVTLRVVNRVSGCESISTDNLEVKVVSWKLDVPNVFTPNGDGANDEFRVVYSSLKKYSIVVFNRWGRKVYESTNPAEGWDGTVAGSMAPPGVYFYYIEAESYEKGEKIKPRKGPIHLIRGK